MTFQYIETVRGIQICGQGKYPEDSLSENDGWIREINRLSGEMDLGGRVAPLPSSTRQNRGQYLTRKEVEWWPYSIRPEGHYDRSWTEILKEGG